MKYFRHFSARTLYPLTGKAKSQSQHGHLCNHVYLDIDIYSTKGASDTVKIFKVTASHTVSITYIQSQLCNRSYNTTPVSMKRKLQSAGIYPALHKLQPVEHSDQHPNKMHLYSQTENFQSLYSKCNFLPCYAMFLVYSPNLHWHFILPVCGTSERHLLFLYFVTFILLHNSPSH